MGRENELAVLRSARQSARHGSAQVIAIEGDPGIGKTALIETLLAEVRAPVIRVTGVEADSLAPWSVLDEIMARLPATRPTPAQGSPAAALAHPFRRPPREVASAPPTASAPVTASAATGAECDTGGASPPWPGPSAGCARR